MATVGAAFLILESIPHPNQVSGSIRKAAV
jgi:hypothetical protein